MNDVASWGPAEQFRILELCLSDARGGLELYVLKIITQLRSRGHTIYSVTHQGSYLSKALEGQWNLDIKRPSWLTFLFAARRIARHMEDHHIDILRINSGYDFKLASLIKRLCKRRIRLVYSRHMAITRSKRDAYHRLLYRQVDLFTAITSKLLKDAQRFLPMDPSNIGLLRYGISPLVEGCDCDDFLNAQKLIPNRFTIGCFSRIEHDKGQHLLIESLQVLHSADVEFQALIIGHVMDESYYNKLQSKVKEYGLQAQVRFMDFIKDPMKIMPCCDVVVLTTYEETFGLVLAEAMHMGVAVMGSNAGGVPEIIEHEITGLMFESGNYQDLADGLIRLYKEPEFRQQLARRGMTSAQEKYSDAKHIERLEGFFSKLKRAQEQVSGAVVSG